MAEPSWVTVGHIVRPHGIKGHVVVAPETDFGHERFAVGATLHAMRDGCLSTFAIAASREHQGRWVLGFDGVTSMNDAERLRGIELFIPAAELRPLETGTFYAHDLAGCAVQTMDGTQVGAVTAVQFGSGTPLLVVATLKGDVLIPLAEAICQRIDVKEKVIVIDPPEGLVELNG